MNRKQRKERANKSRLGNERGFTIGEMMVTILLVLIVGAIVVLGVDFSVRQYNRSMIQSESKILCNTLANVIKTELTNTDKIKLGGRSADIVYGDKEYDVDSFFSPTYAIAQNDKMTGFYSVSVDASHNYTDLADYGELLLGAKVGGTLYGHLLLGSSSYTSYDLGAKVDNFTYDEGSNTFHFKVSVGLDGEELTHKEMDVVPLNALTIIKTGP